MAVVMPKALVFGLQSSHRLGWLAQGRTPGEIFTEAESDPPRASRYFLKEFGDCGRCPFIFLTFQAKGLPKLSLVVKRTLGREGR